MAKIESSKVKKAFAAFMKNPAWKRIYENAPSAQCKKYFRLEFYDSEFDELSAEEFKAEREKILAEFTASDWKYLAETMPANNPFAVRCRQMARDRKM